MEIRKLRLSDEAAYGAFQRLLAEEKNPFIQVKTFDPKGFADFLAKAERLETRADHPDWSTSTNYYAFVDGEIAGRIGCRWELEKGDLATVGGHVGYVTSPKFRQKGIMTALLQFALERYAERGIQSVLITADKENIASRRTIEKAGGRLENTIPLEDGKHLARYWISV